MAKKKTKSTRTERQTAEQPLGAALLAPVAGLVLLTVAAVSSIRDRKNEPVENFVAPQIDDPPADAKGITARLARLPVIGTALKLQARYGKLKGNNVASAVAFQSFVSLFPLLLVIIAVLGFVAASDGNVADKIVSNLGLSGEAARTIHTTIASATKNRAATGPIALVGLFWSGLGLVSAFQYALDQVWQVDERGMKDKAVGLLWLGGAAVLFVGSAAVTTALNWLPGFIAPVGIVLGLAVSFGLWMWTFKILPNRKLPWQALVPGALFGAIGMEILKFVGAFYVPRLVANSSALYGSLGVVFAVLAWLFLFSRLVVYAATFNVIRWEARVIIG